MFKALIIGKVSMATAVSLALATPALANSDMVPENFESAITTAKKAMVADPAKALDMARKAKGLAKGNRTGVEKKDRLIADWLQGEALMRLNRGDDAAAIIGFALFEAAQSHKDDKIYADLLRASASLKARDGDPREALAHFTMAKEQYEKLGDKRSTAIVLQNIGSLYSRADKFEKVLDYYQQASDTFSDDGILSLSANNNIGNALKGLERYDEAEQKFGEALTIAKGMASPLLEARILTNLASAQHLAGNADLAEENARIAMKIAKEFAPDWTPFACGVLAQIELAKGNLAQADELISETFAGRELGATNALFRDFHKSAADIYGQNDKVELAQAHQKAASRLNDQAQSFDL